MKTLIITILALLFSACGSAKAKVVVGAEQTVRYLPQLEGKRVAVLANHTATVGEKHLVDMLVERGVELVGIVSPEHGFRGTADAGEKVASGVDSRTGVPIWSLYSAQGRRLTDEQMAAFDAIIGSEYGKCDAEVERCSLFPQICRSKVDHRKVAGRSKSG